MPNFLTLVLLIGLYCISYVAMRQSYLAREEVCDSNVHVVTVPDKRVYAFYLPLIQFDRYLTGTPINLSEYL